MANATAFQRAIADRRDVTSVRPAHPAHHIAITVTLNLLTCLAVGDRKILLSALPKVGLKPLTFAALGLRMYPKPALLLSRVKALGGDPHVEALPFPAGHLGTNVRTLCDRLVLNPVERGLLLLGLSLREYPALHDLLTSLLWQVGDMQETLAAAIGHEPAEVRRALGPRGRLLSAGLVQTCDDFIFEEPLVVPQRLVEILSDPAVSPSSLLEEILPLAPDVPLALEDFEHLGGEAGLLARILSGALREKAVGVNILVSGCTGAGKTALATVVAKSLAVPLYVVGREARDGGDVTARERLAMQQTGQRLLNGASAVQLFDELEDLFVFSGADARGRPTMSKQFFNWVLESNPIPTIWISNSIEGIDPAFLRRFAYIIEVKAPGRRQRARMVRRIASQLDVAVPESSIEELAAYETGAAQLMTVLKSTKLASGGGFDGLVARRLLEASERAVSGQVTRQDARASRDYRPDVVNASEDLERVASRLVGWMPGRSPGPAMLLYGLPGTGKSEYARQLATRLDRPLRECRGSDLISKYVGDSERNIAEAFRRGLEDGAVLLFDEVDSFLADRSHARYSWEVTATNEFLQQLEGHAGIVICTTNRLESLDLAALRRFVFKVELRPLRADAARALLSDLCARAGLSAAGVAPSALDGISGLNLGDFSAVERRLNQLGGPRDVEEVVDALRGELRARARGGRIGFG